MAEQKEIINLSKINVSHAKVMIAGDGDLCLNKMNDVAARTLTEQRRNKAKTLEKANMWEEVITAIHWRDGKPKDFSEEGLYKALEENAPCITAFGLKKSFGDAVVRNGIDKYKTKFDASVNIVATGNLVPIKFANYTLDEKLMSPKKGSPVLVHLSRFSGWSAEIEISFTENTYSLEQIINIVNLAGFGIGIGSGRTSGYGRYHVVGVE
nr:hypothetical protein [uncultured Blautia sp.]